MTIVHKYPIDDFINLTDDDLNIIMSDSYNNESTLNMIADMMSLHQIQTCTFLKLYNDFSFQVATTAIKEDLAAYYRLGIWQHDIIADSDHVESYRVIDYQQDFDGASINSYLDIVGHKVTFLFEYNVLGCKHTFTFSMPPQAYYDLTETEKYKLAMATVAAAKWMNSCIRLRTLIIPSKTDINLVLEKSNQIEKRPNQHKIKILKQRFNLNDYEIDYLKALATGCTAKEIALQLGKSYRYIQKISIDLKLRFNIEHKHQFENIAQIITASL